MAIDPDEARELSDIEEFGCRILHVMEDEEGPCFTYSIGIEKTSNQPELIVTDLQRETAMWLINEYNRHEGETFEVDKLYADFLEGFHVMFRPVM